MTSVAVQGEAGCFSHVAAVQAFGDDVAILPCRDFTGLFEAVSSGASSRGAVPVENALAGAVVENLDLLVEYPLTVTHEAYVRVELCLVVPPGRSLDGVETAASHPVALRQCRNFFAAHPQISPVAVYDTAGSIRDLMAEDAPYDAAIGSALASTIYGGEVLLTGIEDHRRNYTRFVMVEPRDSAPEGEQQEGTKTSIAFTLPHRPGSLHEALGVLANGGVDLTRLESRPIPGAPWEYRFYADLRGSDRGARAAALRQLTEMAVELHVFGTYPEVSAP